MHHHQGLIPMVNQSYSMQFLAPEIQMTMDINFLFTYKWGLGFAYIIEIQCRLFFF